MMRVNQEKWSDCPLYQMAKGLYQPFPLWTALEYKVWVFAPVQSSNMLRNELNVYCSKI